MTTTATTQLRHHSPSRIRRILPAAFAGVALFAATAMVVNRLTEDDSPRPAATATHESAADVAMMTNAIHVFTPPESAADVAMMTNAIHVFTPPESAADVAMMTNAIHVFTPPESAAAASVAPRLAINEEAALSCGIGVADLCHFTHTWIPAEGGSIAG